MENYARKRSEWERRDRQAIDAIRKCPRLVSRDRFAKNVNRELRLAWEFFLRTFNKRNCGNRLVLLLAPDFIDCKFFCSKEDREDACFCLMVLIIRIVVELLQRLVH